MPVVYIGVGSNIGARHKNCLDAVRYLEQSGVKVIKRSSLLETEPWGRRDQPDFINMVIEAKTDLTPQDLLKVLQLTEETMGRKRRQKWGPRTIDLDLLLYDDLKIRTKYLTIPHPLLHERDFVLIPLADIAPDKIHPVLNKHISDLLKDLRSRVETGS
jgi:2-amino-4-hydroxy-6-hydroxymethyldihydropteridine diphosphokinase